jgi:hypothetical protein
MTREEAIEIAEETVLNEHGNYNEDTKRAAHLAAAAVWDALHRDPVGPAQVSA